MWSRARRPGRRARSGHRWRRALSCLARTARTTCLSGQSGSRPCRRSRCPTCSTRPGPAIRPATFPIVCDVTFSPPASGPRSARARRNRLRSAAATGRAGCPVRRRPSKRRRSPGPTRGRLAEGLAGGRSGLAAAKGNRSPGGCLGVGGDRLKRRDGSLVDGAEGGRPVCGAWLSVTRLPPCPVGGRRAEGGLHRCRRQDRQGAPRRRRKGRRRPRQGRQSLTGGR